MNKLWVELTALVVEDDRVQAQLTTTLLESAGFKTTTVYTGSDAVAAYRANTYHLVVVDLVLPDIGGSDVIQIMRQHTNHSATVIALTGSDDRDQMERAINAGADDLYVKTIGSHVLRAKFSSLAHKMADEQRERLKVEDIEDRLEKNIADLLQCGADRQKEISDSRAETADLRKIVDEWINQPPVLRPEQIEYIATVAATKATAQAAELAAEKAVEIMRRNFELELGRSVLNKGAVLLGSIILAGATYAAGKGWIAP